MAITGFRHVALTVSDLDRSATWYVEVLGFVELFRESQPDRTSVILGVPDTGVVVGLVQFAAASAGGFAPQRVGLDHLCLAVTARDDLEAWTRRLDGHGVSHSGVVAMRTGPIVNFADPDGIALSISLPPSGGKTKPEPRREPTGGRIINPWSWQERAGFVQAHETVGTGRVLYCAGTASVDGDGSPVHVGDMEAQALQALDNLETILTAADYTLGDVVRLNTYVTDVDAYAKARPAVQQRLDAAGCRYAAILLGVGRLARPELLIELEATAAQ